LTFKYHRYYNTNGMKKRFTRAERRERTREDLTAAAESLFTARGFHATTVDEVAFEAGYTKGAVYSNFASKEDLFFAVYERRAETARAEAERVIWEAGDPAAGLRRLAADLARRRDGNEDDGWLAVFFEFWAYVVRNPELRMRFVEIHERFQEPFVAAFERFAEERGIELPVGAKQLAVAGNAMQIGLALERLVRPEVVDTTLGERMGRLLFEDLERSGKET
jgi:AcrR family transcriptional regulator